MRALTACTVASLLLSFPATGARGQMGMAVLPAGPGGVPAASVGARADHGTPRVTSISSDATHPTNDRFTVTVIFSESVDGFKITEVNVDRGATVSDLSGSGSSYSFDVRPDADFEGNLIVTIPAGVAQSTQDDVNNTGKQKTFAVDTRAPRLESATVDDDELVLEYDEDLERNSEPRCQRLRRHC